MRERNDGATPRQGPDGDEVAYRRSPEVLSRRVGEEVIVASAEGDPFLLVGTGLIIWNLLSTPLTVPQLVGELSAAYGAPPAAVGSDVQPFLAELVSRGLVDEIGSGHA
jgi:coenzyme PQQ synthesis protein D (PqqD)